MKTVQQLLALKDSRLHATTADCLVQAAVAEMSRLEIHSLLVMQDDTLAGIFTDRDYVHKIVVPALDATHMTVGEVMTRDVVFIEPQATIRDCVTLMNEGKFRHLPVKDDGRIVGMISMTDIMRAMVNGADEDVEIYI